MNYRILIIALVLGLAGNTYASENDTAISESDSDDRVACVEDAIAEEFEDEKLHEQFIEACLAEKIAQKKKPAEEKASNS